MPHKDPEIARRYRRERYATNHEVRARHQARQAALRAKRRANPELLARRRERDREYQRRRYATDPAYAERRREWSRAKWAEAYRRPEYAAARSARTRARHHDRRYGLTREHFDAMLETQHGRCAICRVPHSDTKGGRLWVDHDHKTDHVRGLLCNNCNFSLGGFKDSPEILEAAAAYLRRTR